MTIADWCLLVAAILPLVSIAPAKLLGRREYDNAAPRTPAFYREGFRARAWGAHLNGFEAFPFFAAAVLLAEMRHAPQGTIDTLALCFVAARVAYLAAYWGNQATLRSILWGVGFVTNLALFVLPAVAL